MNELKILASSLLYFTRLKLPFQVPYSKDSMTKILTWFPFVGLIVGGLGALTWWGLSLILPQAVAVIFSMVVTILLTGAFHEDGFADVCDGFGGGYTKEKILLIMKDSTVGAYGALGMILMLLTKFVLLSNSDVDSLLYIIIIAHTMSRVSALFITQVWDYARTEDSKAKMPSQHLSPLRFIIAFVCGFAPLCLMPLQVYWFVPLVAIVAALLMGKYFHKQIGGYTGDCLGATQQVVEVLIYTSFLIIQ